MTKQLNTGQLKALKDLQDFYEYASNSTIRQKWLDSYQVNLSFYTGDQWLDEEMARDMKDIGAKPYTYNNIEPLVNAYVSLQIRSSKRVGYEAVTDNPQHVLIAEHLKQLAYSIQTRNDHVFFSSQKFTSSLIGGIGWSYFSYDNDEFKYDYVDPTEIFWDPDDRSLRLDNSSYVCRVRYVPAIKLKNEYPKFDEQFEDMVDKNSINPSENISETLPYGNNFNHGSENITHTGTGTDVDDGQWTRGRSIKIIEVYYKKPETYYETTAIFPLEKTEENEAVTEHKFSTFDEELAKKYSIDGNIETKKGTQIWRGVYCDDLLLEHNPIIAQVPNQQYLPLVPIVLRRNQQGVPYGVVDNLIPAQQTHNFLWSTTMHYLDAKTLITTDTNADDELKREDLRTEMRLKNGVIYTQDMKSMQLLDHEANLTYRMNLLKSNYREFETQTGLYDELKGEQTNAVSGVAIKQRASNSMNAQNGMILSYENMLISEGKIMLDSIKGVKGFKRSFKFMQEGKDTTASLDESVALLGFEVYPDTSANFSSSIEEEKVRFSELLESPNLQLLLTSATFLKEIGFTEKAAHSLSEEYQKITGMQQMLEEQAAQEELQQKEQEVQNGQ